MIINKYVITFIVWAFIDLKNVIFHSTVTKSQLSNQFATVL